ncbi:hypothetical protein WSM22_39620 [Cytophagales bacterium WSM2-2]|nr:hypothetical protein WSM22_39620 [Cytophagales bacterium WSM2-2]
MSMKNVLLVDDDKICNLVSEKMLQRIGPDIDIRTALNGKEALKVLSDYSPDIILLDLNMPIMNGFGFLDAFRDLDLPNKENIQIVVVSSSDNPADIANAKRNGADKYLVKPIEVDTLRAALDRPDGRP